MIYQMLTVAIREMALLLLGDVHLLLDFNGNNIADKVDGTIDVVQITYSKVFWNALTRTLGSVVTWGNDNPI